MIKTTNLQVGLIDTLKIVTALEDLQGRKKQLLSNREEQLYSGLIHSRKLNVLAIRMMIAFSIVYFSLDYFLHDMRASSFLFLPLFAFLGTLTTLAIIIILLLYNKYRLYRNKRMVNETNFKTDLEYCKVNIETLENALAHSIVPNRYRNTKDLEKMCIWLNNKVVSDEMQAIKKILESE